MRIISHGDRASQFLPLNAFAPQSQQAFSDCGRESQLLLLNKQVVVDIDACEKVDILTDPLLQVDLMAQPNEAIEICEDPTKAVALDLDASRVVQLEVDAACSIEVQADATIAIDLGDCDE